MRSGPAIWSVVRRVVASACCSVVSAGTAVSRKWRPASVSAMLRVVRWNSRTPRCCSSCASAWLAACGVMLCASAALRRLRAEPAVVLAEPLGAGERP